MSTGRPSRCQIPNIPHMVSGCLESPVVHGLDRTQKAPRAVAVEDPVSNLTWIEAFEPAQDRTDAAGEGRAAVGFDGRTVVVVNEVLWAPAPCGDHGEAVGQGLSSRQAERLMKAGDHREM